MALKPITLDELADIYDERNGGRRARTLRIETVVNWALVRKDIFTVDEDDNICVTVRDRKGE